MNYKTNGLTTTVLGFTIVVLASSYLLLIVVQPGLQPQSAYSQQQYNTTITTTQVEIVNGSSNPDNGQFYVPPEIRISSGSTVEWTNNDIAIHTVTQGNPSDADAGSALHFDSSLMPIGSTFEHTFNDTGLVDYYCTIHPWMTGKVTIN